LSLKDGSSKSPASRGFFFLEGALAEGCFDPICRRDPIGWGSSKNQGMRWHGQETIGLEKSLGFEL
jgi:hypothetical protein